MGETPLEDWVFAPDYASPLLENHFGVLSLEGFGLAGKPAAACAAGAILHYVRSTQRGTLHHVDRIGFYEKQNCLVLDAVTVRNLELVEPLFAGSTDEVTLVRAIDTTITPMGRRLLRSWMLRPSIDIEEIGERLDSVEQHSQQLSGSGRAAAFHGRHVRPRAPIEPRHTRERNRARSAGTRLISGEASGHKTRAVTLHR